MRPKTTLCLLIMISLVLLMGSVPFSETIAQSDRSEESSIPVLQIPKAPGDQINSIVEGPGFVTISSYKFVTVSQNDPMGRSGYFIYNPRATDITYAAPVDLPNGATIKKILLYYYDTVSTNNLIVKLRRADQSNGADIELGTTLSWADTGLGSEYVDITENNLVDLQNYYYFLTVTIPGGQLNKLGLISVRVDYAYPGYLPLVTDQERVRPHQD